MHCDNEDGCTNCTCRLREAVNDNCHSCRTVTIPAVICSCLCDAQVSTVFRRSDRCCEAHLDTRQVEKCCCARKVVVGKTRRSCDTMCHAKHWGGVPPCIQDRSKTCRRTASMSVPNFRNLSWISNASTATVDEVPHIGTMHKPCIIINCLWHASQQ